MTLLTADSIVTHVGNASTVAFPYSRKFISNSHVFVTLDGVPTTAYSLIGAGSESGGTVTFDSAPGSGVRIVIYRAVPFTQETDLENFDGNPAVVHENQLDLIVMQTQNLDERVDRAIVSPVDDVAVNLVLPKASTRANGYPYFGSSGEILVTTDAVGVSAAAAAASASAASSSASAAASSAASAAAIAGSALWSNVVFLTNANSPYAVTSANSGDLLSIDTTAGAVVVNLPQISTLTLPFNVGIKKSSSDTNLVTINRAGTDTIGPAATSKTLSVQNQGATLVADTDPVPDQWAVGDFGDVTTVIPSQSGNAGKHLITNGTVTSWDTAIPSQSGNSGKLLTTNGTVTSWGDASIALISTATITSTVTNVEFVNGIGGVVIDSTYKFYRLVFNNLNFTADPSKVLISYRDASAFTWDAGGAAEAPALRINSATSTIQYWQNEVADLLRGSTAQLSGHIDIYGLSVVANKVALGFATALGSSSWNVYISANNQNATAVVDGIRLSASGGDFTSGTVYLYGFK